MVRRDKKRSRSSPDGRLGLEITTTEDTSSSLTSTTTRNNPPTDTASKSASSGPSTSRLLHQLSESCKNHLAFHKDRPSTDANNIACENEASVPKFCRDALKILRGLLPRVEKHYRAVGPSDSSSSAGPTPLDVRHICDFYCNVLAGGFCVHAPHLFRLGKGAGEVLPRVFYLLQHAVSPSIIRHTTEEYLQNVEVGVADIIAVTVARLLNLVPGNQFDIVILRDLVHMIGDLAMLQRQHSAMVDTVEIILFPFTTAESDLPENTEFILELTSLDVIVVLESTLTCILSQFLSSRRSSRLHPTDDVVPSLPIGFEKSNAYFSAVLNDTDLIFDLVDSLGQIFSRPWTYYTGQRIVDFSTKCAAVASVKISHFLLLDSNAGLLHESVKMKLGLMVAQSVFRFLTASSGGESTTSPVQQSLAEGLSRLMQHIFVHEENRSVLQVIQRCTFPVLMDCVRILYKTQGRDVMLTHSQLSSCVLESLCTISRQRLDGLFDQFTYFADIPSSCEDVCQNLFRAMHDPKLVHLVAPMLLSDFRRNISERQRPLVALCLSMFGSEHESGIDCSASERRLHLPPSSDEPNQVNERTKKRAKTHHSSTWTESSYERLFVEFIMESLAIAEGKTLTTSAEPYLVSVLLELMLDVVRRSHEDALINAVIKCIRYLTSWMTQNVEQHEKLEERVPVALFVVNAIRRVRVLATSFGEEKEKLCGDLVSLCIQIILSAQHGISKNTSISENEVIPALLPHILQDQVELSVKAIRMRLERTCENDRLSKIKEGRLRDILQFAFTSHDVVVRSIAVTAASHLLAKSADAMEISGFAAQPPVSGSETRSTCDGRFFLEFLVKSALEEGDMRLRDYASRTIGKFLLAGNPFAVTLALATEDELSRMSDQEQQKLSEPYVKIQKACVVRFFELMDKILVKLCSTAKSSHDKALTERREFETLLFYKRAALRCLSSIGEACDLGTKMGKFMFTRALLMASRMGSALHDQHAFEIPGLFLAETRRLVERLNLDMATQARILGLIGPPVFIGALDGVVATTPDDFGRVEHIYQALSGPLKLYASRGQNSDSDVVGDVALAASSNFILLALEDCVPIVLGQMILDRNYQALRLVAGFKLFQLAQKQVDGKIDTRRSSFLSYLDVGDRSFRRKKGKRLWTKELDHQLYLLAQAPQIVERMLPLVFQRANQRELLFLVKDVLKDKRDLQTMLSGREQLILKTFVKELGRSSDPRLALRALLLATKARESPSFLSHFGQLQLSDNPNYNEASPWISSHFMYLLVNVVQSRWHNKEMWEKIEDLRSLNHILDFLHATDGVAQFLPQVMATVNGAIAQKSVGAVSSMRLEELRLIAVQCMSKFVKLVSSVNAEIVGENLASMVAALLPVLSEDEPKPHVSKNSKRPELTDSMLSTKSRALSIIGFLSEGELGKSLAPFFSEISFLFQLPHLEKAKVSFSSHGLGFDSEGTASPTNGISSEDDAQKDMQKKQYVLHRQLDGMIALVSHEDASVRQVVLQHLIAVIRQSRAIFYSLIENEPGTSASRFVTVAKAQTSRGIITELIECLLSRCAVESNQIHKLLLASCLGEIGAIAEYRLNDTVLSHGSEDYSGNDSHLWRLKKPPWKVQPNIYGLQLVTSELVWALRAAPSSSDQHKIGYAIQQLLVLLQGVASKDHSMDKRLSDELANAGVLEIVLPFWQSEFHEQSDSNAQKQPPFFSTSFSYLSWISNWSRHMVTRSQKSQNHAWNAIFFACRTAFRTQSSNVAEFLLPLLVLDRLCYGDPVDHETVVREIIDVLTLNEDKGRMRSGDLQMAVSAVFTVVETFQYWLEQDIEERYSGGSKMESTNGVLTWPPQQSTMRIEDILRKIPYKLQASAAARVGMNARSLRLFEMASRFTVAESVFGSSRNPTVSRHQGLGCESRAAGVCPDDCYEPMKGVLLSLDDHETLTALTASKPRTHLRTNVTDIIRERVASHDWNGALHEHERALQTEDDSCVKSLHQRGILQCLLELGQYESVLNQIQGLAFSLQGSASSSLGPYAVQAAWRLGKWEELSEIVRDLTFENEVDLDGNYNLSLGKALVAIHNKQSSLASRHLRDARYSVTELLAVASRDSYRRSYEQIVRLRSLQEVEDFLQSHLDDGTCSNNISSTLRQDWNWSLEVAAPESALSLINVRLALSRLALDSATEGRLFLSVGKRARNRGTYNVAADAFARADEAFRSCTSIVGITDISALRLERAKLKHKTGESSEALRLLDLGDIAKLSLMEKNETLAEVSRRVASVIGFGKHKVDENDAVQVFVRSALKSLKWTIASGLKGGNEILCGFRFIHCIAPEWEKAQFHYAKYAEEVMRSRASLLQRRASKHSFSGYDDGSMNETISLDKTCQKFLVLAVSHYAEALKLDLKHLYQALPRLLSLWFQFTFVTEDLPQNQEPANTQAPTEDQKRTMKKSRNEAQTSLNEFMAKSFKSIPAQAFYSAIAQLVSRITHPNQDTRNIVREMLRRVLTKFPEQTMWHLAWLVHSKDQTRRLIVKKIFTDSCNDFINQKNEVTNKLLQTSVGLFKHLHDLARYEIKDQRKTELSVKPWQGEVPLTAFIPPVQAALCLSHTQYSTIQSSTVFSTQVPRMRAWCRRIRVMVSKARPKKVTAFVTSWDPSKVFDPTPDPIESDIGEMHFLIKQEAAGDLRKDARVQDLNNVINRLLLSSTKQSQRSQRGLRLRTFAVTCLSEETGILEWVAHTKSLRNLVGDTYNPMAPTSSSSRRGSRISRLDPALKHTFEKKCQDVFVSQGDLRRAALLFEDLCLKPNPPLLFWWFVQNFPNPHAWYEARTRFAQSAASWSAVGHVIGLGDRHAENILVDTSSGEIVHVDFDCIFDKGLSLPKPEIVPFRLTANLVDAFGPCGTDGIFSGSLKDAMSTLRRQSTTLLSVLEPFINDPVIEWKRTRSQQKSSRWGQEQHRHVREAKRSINVIDERLRGIYNLRNKNLKAGKQLLDSHTDQEDEELTQVMALSVEGQVHKLIAEASSSENLVQLFSGWMPWV